MNGWGRGAVGNVRRPSGGVSVGKVVKRLLKPFVLRLLNLLEDKVETSWQRGQGPSDGR